MEVSARVKVNASKEAIWSVIKDIDNAPKNISGIVSVEVLERPTEGLVGLKWREQRVMFGKEAYETMWVTDSEENSFYQTRAESHGANYISKMLIEDNGDSCVLEMSFKAEALTFGAKVGNFVFSGMMKKSTEKALFEDLKDIKKVAEAI